MGIGAAVGFFVAGAILYWAVDVDLPYVDDDALGAILVVAGIVAVVAAAFTNTRRGPHGASVGSGIGLLVAGAILYWAVSLDLPFIADDALGVILMIAGGITIGATVVLQWQSSRTSHMVGHR